MEDDAIRDLFAGLGPISIRRMFGGKGIYHQGVVFALQVDGEILLKADARSAPAFQAVGCRQWMPAGRKGRGPVAMPYWSIPESAIDDAEEMTLWARRAYEAGVRSIKK